MGESARSVGREITHRLAFCYRAVGTGFPSLWWLVEVSALILGVSAVVIVALVLERPMWAVGIVAAVLLLALIEGAYRLQLRETEARQDAARRLAQVEPRAPQLSFGRAVIPRESETVFLGDFETNYLADPGRIIRVPVMNAHGADEAQRVHARLRFTLPGDGVASDQFVPSSAQGEWVADGGGFSREINIPGNARPYLVNVVFILDRYPHAYEWTEQSRAALLASSYEIQSKVFWVEVEIKGAGAGAAAPYLKDVLEIDCMGGTLRADWLSTKDSEPTNYAPWKGYG